MLDDIDLDDISLETLRSLVESKVPESERLDYKREVYGKGDNREIAKDVSALANTQGGHLVLGILDVEGEPTEIVGLEGINLDAEIRRMDDVLRTSVQPSITGVRFKPIRDGERLAAIVVRVPRSWRAPHQVVANSTYRFYGRRARSNAPLDVDALRSLFSLSETIGDRIRRFRDERLALIRSGNTSVAVAGAHKVIWHAIPFRAFGSSGLLNVGALLQSADVFDRLGVSSGLRRSNVDGVIRVQTQDPVAYAQVYRNGTIEVAEEWPRHDPNGVLVLPSDEIAKAVRGKLSATRDILRAIGADAPVAVGITLVGMCGWRMGVGQDRRQRDDWVFDRDVIVIPDHLVETLDGDIDRDARPILDMIWQAAGWPAAEGFDENGRWVGLRR
jgi:hypothetical protein